MTRYTLYRLNEQDEPVPCSLDDHLRQLDHPERLQVARTDIDDVTVSTVFLGMGRKGERPVLWETMVLIDWRQVGVSTQQYATRAEAEAGHNAVVEHVKATKPEQFNLQSPETWLEATFGQSHGRVTRTK